jgi:hypothetical protein
MTPRDKNPYDQNTPEWQLWENMESSRLLSLTLAEDADRALKKSQDARERSQAYQVALEKLSK